MRKIFSILSLGFCYVSATKVCSLDDLCLKFLQLSDPKPSTWDPSSYANVEQIQTTNFEFDVTADFDTSTLSGTNVLTLKAV